MSKFSDQSWKFARPYGHNEQRGTLPHVWLDGHVVTPHGVVCAGTNLMPREGLTSLWMVHKGREYSRRFPKDYSKRYLVTLAVRFAKDVVSGKVKA